MNPKNTSKNLQSINVYEVRRNPSYLTLGYKNKYYTVRADPHFLFYIFVWHVISFVVLEKQISMIR